MEKTQKLGGFSKTGGAAQKPSPTPIDRWSGGRPTAVLARKQEPRQASAEPATKQAAADEARDFRLGALVSEWLLDLQVMGRSERTLTWYREKMEGFIKHSGASTLADVTPLALKQRMADEQRRGLSDNTVHGSYQVVRGFTAWATREGYPADGAILRVRPPQVAQKEPETYTAAQAQAVIKAAAPGWAQMAVMILLGTGMRVSEMCALTVDDIEDDGEATTLKVRRGKGAKFRRVPVSSRLRRELVRYVNRLRPETATDRLLVLADGRPAEVRSVKDLHKRIAGRVGFQVHAHKFRHTFATEYLRNQGEIERLRRILGHTTYVMVMRYVHLDKGDLCRDFDLRSPF